MVREDSAKLVWFLAGVSIGAAIAILYAPSSGEVTRRRIARRAEDGLDSIKETGEDMLDRGRDLFEKGKKIADEAAGMFDRGRKLVQG